MNSGPVEEIAVQLTKLVMFPWFWSAHVLLCALSIRQDIGSDAHGFSRMHPFASWTSTMLTVYAGGFLAHALLGEPILDPLQNTPQLLIATGMWYLVFYTPFNMGLKIAKFFPLYVACNVMQEIFRCFNIYEGVQHAAKLYPSSYIIMIIIGTIKGNGGAFTKIIERLTRGSWTPTAVEFMFPSFHTKASILASILFVLTLNTSWIPLTHHVVYLGIVLFLIFFKMAAILACGCALSDPFLPLEYLTGKIFFGGIWDSLAEYAEESVSQIENEASRDSKKRK